MRKIAVLGGDARQVEAARVLAAEGFDVHVCGLPAPVPGDGLAAGAGGLTLAASVGEALAGAAAAVGPVQGATASGGIWTRTGVPPVNLGVADLAGMAPGAPLLIGIGNPALRRLCEAAGTDLIEYREDDDFALLNAIPSAEGAIAMAMEMTPYTLFGSVCYIIGFGRTGEILALRLKALGADTVVATRKPAAMAQAQAHGHRVIPFSRLAAHLGEAQIVFNTAPSQVLTGQTVAAIQPGSVIIDLASAPGGTDFEAARLRGIQAVLAPGLPGKVAPQSAGRYVAQVVLRTLSNRPGLGR
ncbi:MAG: dipicolinate synthase subunit DpsA [Symbiobacteriia bacterium]